MACNSAGLNSRRASHARPVNASSFPAGAGRRWLCWGQKAALPSSSQLFPGGPYLQFPISNCTTECQERARVDFPGLVNSKGKPRPARVCSVHNESSPSHGQSHPTVTNSLELGKLGRGRREGERLAGDSSPSFLPGTQPWMGHSLYLGLSFSLCKMGMMALPCLPITDKAVVS